MAIEFAEDRGTYVGVDPHGRCWRITRVFTGWRLEFRDDGDMTATFAGVHSTVQAAQAEASRQPNRPR